MDEVFAIQLVDQQGAANSAFVRANGALLLKYVNEFNQATSVNDRMLLLKNHWLAEHNAILNESEIVFNRKTDMTMFLLTWS